MASLSDVIDNMLAALEEERNPTGDREHRSQKSLREVTDAFGSALRRIAAEVEVAGKASTHALAEAETTLREAGTRCELLESRLLESATECNALRGSVAALKDELASVRGELDAARLLSSPEAAHAAMSVLVKDVSTCVELADALRTMVVPQEDATDPKAGT